MRRHQDEFEVDNEGVCGEQHVLTGEMEKRLFLMLADICRRYYGHGNANQASKIMALLCYSSYHHNLKRFRMKLENVKKIENRNRNRNARIR